MSACCCLCRDALDKFEPAALDNIGASWAARDEYRLQPTAKRFESYEMSFAAKVCSLPGYFTGCSVDGRPRRHLPCTWHDLTAWAALQAVQVGLGVAVQQCVQLGIRRIWARIQQLAALVRDGLGRLPGVTVQDRGRLLCGLVSFTVAGLTGGWGFRGLRVHLVIRCAGAGGDGKQTLPSHVWGVCYAMPHPRRTEIAPVRPAAPCAQPSRCSRRWPRGTSTPQSPAPAHPASISSSGA